MTPRASRSVAAAYGARRRSVMGTPGSDVQRIAPALAQENTVGLQDDLACRANCAFTRGPPFGCRLGACGLTGGRGQTELGAPPQGLAGPRGTGTAAWRAAPLTEPDRRFGESHGGGS